LQVEVLRTVFFNYYTILVLHAWYNKIYNHIYTTNIGVITHVAIY